MDRKWQAEDSSFEGRAVDGTATAVLAGAEGTRPLVAGRATLEVTQSVHRFVRCSTSYHRGSLAESPCRVWTIAVFHISEAIYRPKYNLADALRFIPTSLVLSSKYHVHVTTRTWCFTVTLGMLAKVPVFEGLLVSHGSNALDTHIIMFILQD